MRNVPGDSLIATTVKRANVCGLYGRRGSREARGMARIEEICVRVRTFRPNGKIARRRIARLSRWVFFPGRTADTPDGPRPLPLNGPVSFGQGERTHEKDLDEWFAIVPGVGTARRRTRDSGSGGRGRGQQRHDSGRSGADRLVRFFDARPRAARPAAELRGGNQRPWPAARFLPRGA